MCMCSSCQVSPVIDLLHFNSKFNGTYHCTYPKTVSEQRLPISQYHSEYISYFIFNIAFK